jgi:hypothetical protein
MTARGAVRTVAKFTKAMAGGGTLFIDGSLSPEPTPLPVMEARGESLTVRGYTMIETTANPETSPLEQMAEAHRFR